MIKYSFLFLLSIFFILGCEQKPLGGVAKMHWDRDMCERCKMAISERKYAVEVIEPKRNKVYKFDDIGCAVLWMQEEKMPWMDSAIIWITDAKSGAWIDAKKAQYTDDSITPMAFGFAAFSKSSAPQNHTVHSFDDIIEKIFAIEALNRQKVGEKR